MKTKKEKVEPVMVFDGHEYFDNYLNRYLPDVIKAVAGIKESYNTLVEEVDFPKFNKEVFLKIIKPDAVHDLKVDLDKTLPTLPKAIRHLAFDVFKEESQVLSSKVKEFRQALTDRDSINRISNAPPEVVNPEIFEFDTEGNITTSDQWKANIRDYFNHYLFDADEIELYNAMTLTAESFNKVVTLIQEKRFHLPVLFAGLFQTSYNTDLVKIANESIKFKLSLRK